MILAVGTDLCEIARISEAISRRGEVLLDRLFTVAEQQVASRRQDRATFYAGRFAAKEACAKALGTGVTDRVRWTEIEILPARWGMPTMTLTGGAAQRLSWLAGKDRQGRIHVSISHCGEYALAFVLLEGG